MIRRRRSWIRFRYGCAALVWLAGVVSLIGLLLVWWVARSGILEQCITEWRSLPGGWRW
ncbi:MAG: hypothetical protein M0Z36_04255 [Thermaerobacter sp.]|nr:hypothetical protein [Thermaerobacter sp.]